MVEGARLEIVLALIALLGFKSLTLRHPKPLENAHFSGGFSVLVLHIARKASRIYVGFLRGSRIMQHEMQHGLSSGCVNKAREKYAFRTPEL